MRKHTKWISFLMAACMVLLFTGCAGGNVSRTYDKAQKALAKGKYEKAAELFDSISSYEDASKLAMYSNALQYGEQKQYEKAIDTLRFLGNFKDSEQLEQYYDICILSLSEDTGDLLVAAKQFDAISAFRDSADRAETCRKTVYDKALSLFKEGEYETAKRAFHDLGDYKDCKTQVQKCSYAIAKASVESREYGKAIELFSSLGSFQDSGELVEKTFTEAVEYVQQLSSEGEFESALVILSGIEPYGDVSEVRQAVRYSQAAHLMETAKYADAAQIFTEINGYKDSGDQLEKCVAAYREQLYNEAADHMKNAEYKDALEIFEQIAEYKDSVSLGATCIWEYLGRTGYWDADTDLVVRFFNQNQTAFSKMTAAEIKAVLDKGNEKQYSSSRWRFGVSEGSIHGRNRHYSKDYGAMISFKDGEYTEGQYRLGSSATTYKTYEWYQVSSNWFVVIEPGERARSASDLWICLGY